MIFKDRVTIETSVNGSLWTSLGVFPAEVRPVGTDEQISAGRDAVITRYRVFVSKRAPLGASSRHVRVIWRDYGPTGEGTSGTYLVMDGGVTVLTRNRRVEAFSFVTASVTG